MFGGGVYYANRTTKSVRYTGATKPGDTGTLLLCRVALGRPMVKYLPKGNMRRPPDPFPLFGWEHLVMWCTSRKFHSVFAPASQLLLMDEFIVYHTNQVDRPAPRAPPPSHLGSDMAQTSPQRV